MRIGYRAHEPTRDFVFGLGIFNGDGVCCYGTNTNLEELEPDRLSGEGEVRFVVDRLDLVEGTYKFDIAVHKLDGYPYDYHRQLYTIRVKAKQKDVGIYRPPHRWEFTGDITFRAPGTGDQATRPDSTRCRVLTSEQAASWAAEQRAAGRRVVFTNGVFDLLHPGHTRYLADARAQGDVLVVAVNSDRSVRALAKGPDRPVTPEHERAELLAALAAVDAVVIFDEDTPLAIVAAIQPDVLVKGADWADDAIVGREVVEARGGRVVRVALAPGYSTTTILDRVRAASGAG